MLRGSTLATRPPIVDLCPQAGSTEVHSFKKRVMGIAAVLRKISDALISDAFYRGENARGMYVDRERESVPAARCDACPSNWRENVDVLQLQPPHVPPAREAPDRFRDLRNTQTQFRLLLTAADGPVPHRPPRQNDGTQEGRLDLTHVSAHGNNDHAGLQAQVVR